ncbi:hypothetical protein LTR84_004688 [Exophiala bonariae]|uniref:NAD(P)-binding protein n=1 Tax=Exophiala bonariae TaxID=1690606 RepID=A0AAV9NRC6_9EURO|nr:hypothetical protein LTR84_004688 [Exophiala bonariae]
MLTTELGKIILVTGANRGIGFSIIQGLASHPDTVKATFLLGCRDASKGKDAIGQLHRLGVKSDIKELVLDVSSDISIAAAVESVQSQYGHLDVLINNAGYAAIPSSSDTSDWRDTYSKVFDTNVTSVAVTAQKFLPLLRQAKNGGKVIQISSARGSITRSASGQLPPTVSIPYVISKSALNILTIEMSRDPANANVEFSLASPGHCKTAFNGFRGSRDPLEGANVVVELVRAPRGKYRNAGFWETMGDSLELVEVPW